jgi:hypothetical protein
MKHPTSKIMTVAGTALAACIPFAGLAGIQGSGFRSFVVVAPVTSSSGGRVSVGGVPYSDSGASLEVDGQTGDASQIEVGDVVTAYGHQGNGGKPDVIERLILNHSVRAGVDSVDLTNNTFVAAGQTIHINTQTALDPTLALVGLTAVLPGAQVRISGWSDSTGDIIASRIELLALGAATQVGGHVSSLDSQRHRFKINQLTVDFSGAQVEGLLQEAADVLVTGARFDSTGALLAKEVQLVVPLQVSAGQTGRLEGIVTSMTSATDFEINGQPVQVSSVTKQNLHGPIALDAQVKVDGVFDDNGVLVVNKLQTQTK